MLKTKTLMVLFIAVCVIPLTIIIYCKISGALSPVISTLETNIVVKLPNQEEKRPFGMDKDRRNVKNVSLTNSPEFKKLSDDDFNAIRKSKAMAKIMNSPARDTKEFRQIFDILNKKGYTAELMEPVYNIAYKLGALDADRAEKTNGKVNGEPYDPSNPKHVEMTKRYIESQSALSKLQLNKVGIDEGTIDELLTVTPKVFFGNVGIDININNSPSYTGDDVKKYFSEHPVTQ